MAKHSEHWTYNLEGPGLEGGILPKQMMGCSAQNFENTPKRYQNLVLWACPKFNSIPKRYQFNSNKLYNWYLKF